MINKFLDSIGAYAVSQVAASISTEVYALKADVTEKLIKALKGFVFIQLALVAFAVFLLFMGVLVFILVANMELFTQPALWTVFVMLGICLVFLWVGISQLKS